jgi:hypothetical protein
MKSSNDAVVKMSLGNEASDRGTFGNGNIPNETKQTKTLA